MRENGGLTNSLTIYNTLPRLSMARLTRRRLRCFYCSNYSHNDKPGIPRSWFCSHCEAVNHLDENGDIADPPAESTSSAFPVRYGRARSSSPVAMSTESPFCPDCQRNQMIVNQALAEYIPDEDDPEYEQRAATADVYRAEVEQKFPQVCDKCVEAVRKQMRAAGYAAKADHFRRMLETSRKSKLEFCTPRQIWTLRAIALGKWAYIGSIVIGALWHGLGILAVPGLHGVSADEKCFTEIIPGWKLDQVCFESDAVSKCIQWTLYADVLTFWWNSKLVEKTNRAGGRMRGLTRLWIARAVMLASRYATLHYFDNVPEDPDALKIFRYVHATMLVFTLLSAFLSWKTVRIDYQSTRSFMQSLAPHLPNVQSVVSGEDTPTQPKSLRPNATTYDTMAQSFTSSLANADDGQYIEYPPSPTLTEASISTRATAQSTPYLRKARTPDAFADQDEDTMDWTPTARKFGREQEIQPPIWSRARSVSSSNQSVDEPAPKHSLFAQKDPNPFANRVPAFPKSQKQKELDPWKPGLWAPALPVNKQNHLSDLMKKGESPETIQRMVEGVPKRVRRDEELFQKPKLMYDYQGYAGYKTTGLEDTFNNMFSM